MKKINLTNVSILMFFMFNLAFGQKSIELKYNLQENDQYQYTTETKQNITMEADGMEMDMEMGIDMFLIYTIGSQTNENISIDGKINRIKMSQSIFGMNVDYDSDQPNSNNPMLSELDEEFQKILEKPFNIAIDYFGNIKNLDLSNIAENNELANSFNSGTSFAIYPKNKINIGDSWNEDIVPSPKSDMKYTVKYTLVKIENTQAKINFEGVITANKVNDVDLNLSGTVNGEMLVDTTSGWLIESLLTQNLKMDIQQGDIIIPATSVGTIKSTSTKI